ncbi:hypothetical protein IQ250_01165 [Pseudanabaenaceae cyanobacterium LEGE 13415]|nr:hypothetical protein [Pseudanabaenaceae cyanobacterium LEGE 13415]
MTKKASLSEFNHEEWSIAPNGLKKLIQFALSRGEKSEASKHDDSLFPGFYWGGSTLEFFGFEACDSGRYPKAPPEFSPFAHLGQDGIYYGYVVHAPELNITNSPIGIFDPIPDEGVKLLGNDFEDALDKLLSEALGFYLIDEELQTINAIASLLNVQPNLDKRNPRYMEYDDPILPVIPPGWHYEPSSDGIGVLAPREAFISNSPTRESWSFDIFQGKGYPMIQAVEAALQFAKECFERNAPASALFVLRELYWRSSDDRVFIQSKELWKNAYSQLGRPLLSNVVEQEARARQQWLEKVYEPNGLM